MEYKIEKFKEDIVFIELNNGDKLKVVLSNFGAGIYSLRYDNNPLILEIEDKNIWLNEPNFYGKTLARVAGRIMCKGEIDGVPYNLDETMAGYSLHGDVEVPMFMPVGTVGSVKTISPEELTDMHGKSQKDSSSLTSL